MEQFLLEQNSYTNSLRDFLTIIFKHKYKIRNVFLAIVITVTVGTFLLPPVYEAKSTLIVKFGREHIYRPEVGDTNSTISFQSFNQEKVINTEVQILTSRDLAGKTIGTLRVENIYPDLAKTSLGKVANLESTILQFEKNLSVESIKNSNVIEVSFQHKDPDIAAKAVNLLVELFKEKHIQVFSNPKSSFLENQLNSYRQKLEESENNLEVFKQKHEAFSLDEQTSLLLNQRTELDTSLKTAQNHIKGLEQKFSSLENQMKSISATVPLYTVTGANKIIDDAKTKLLALKLKEQELLTKYEVFEESRRWIANVRKEMQLVEDFLKEQEEDLSGKVTTGKNVTYQEMEMELFKTRADLSSQVAKSINIQQQLNQLDKEMRNLGLRERKLRTLKRELSTNERNYKTYLSKSEEARLSKEMDRQKMVNISVIQEATVPAKPIKPRRLLNIALGIFLGAVSGLGFAFISEYIGQGLSTPENAKNRLGLPIIATVSYKG